MDQNEKPCHLSQEMGGYLWFCDDGDQTSTAEDAAAANRKGSTSTSAILSDMAASSVRQSPFMEPTNTTKKKGQVDNGTNGE